MAEQGAAVQASTQSVFGDGHSLEEEKAAAERIVRANPNSALPFITLCLHEKHRYQTLYQNVQKAHEELRQTLREGAWYPATFIRLLPGAQDRALVAMDGRRLTVKLTTDVDRERLASGETVFLNSSLSALVDLAPELRPQGSVGEFSRHHGDHAVVRGPAGEELVVELVGDLSGDGLSRGDRVVYSRDNLVAWEKVAVEEEEGSFLQELPADVNIDQLGGLDEVFSDIVDEITLHLFHPEVVRRHKLEPVKGILLIGPPGVGKTSLVKSVAHHLSELRDIKSRVFLVPPSVHRSKWFGESEERVRAMFAEVRRAAGEENGYALMVFDDVDQLGTRDAAYAIDSRIMPSFLHEIVQIRSAERILLIGATNRPDLLDEALQRPGRLGDRVFTIPRPETRRAAREILRRYLSPELPYAMNGDQRGSPGEEIVERVLSALYAPNGEFATLARLHFRDGSIRPVTPGMVMSGALVRNAVEGARRRSSLRTVKGGREGISISDVLAAFDRELWTTVQHLKPGPSIRILDLPPDMDVVRVEIPPRSRERRTYAYLRESEP